MDISTCQPTDPGSVQPPQLTMAVPKQCSGCKQPITDRYLLNALDVFWHESCLNCSCCGCRLGEIGTSLFTKSNLLLCRRDYLRLFGKSGCCSACQKVIPAFEMVMKTKGNVYHLNCFACQQCRQRFCVGDRFYLFENRILCEFDYESRASCLTSPIESHQAPTNTNNLSFCCSNTQPPRYQYPPVKQNGPVALSDDASSGYGSPSPTSL